ncbi:DsbA family protein [Williamsia sterculiae]|uniref:Protein-disulfide isomerase n=1 Tax=Williamsia sterculiae TaxID=1344003 RepID=A0A1N7H957_9NOCA|nr:thioredoxin domain-containing protein [Williamsia sterculiae]SIS21230.1 Protein-disulfide isomerase [Williamsia sterculiae]
MTGSRQRKPVVDPRAAEKRRSMIIRIAATAVVIIVAVIVAVVVIVSKNSDDSSSASNASTSPTVVTDTGAFRVSGPKANAKAVLTLDEDFQCPVCKQFETLFGSALEQLRSNPNVAIDYHPIAILDRMSSTGYSTRAANASACVAQATAAGGDFATWLKYHQALYAQQPEEGSAGLADQQLTEIATSVGAPASVSSCVDKGVYNDWVTAQTKQVSENGLQGTPQVELNGKTLTLSTPDALVAAVNAAAEG